MPDKSKNLRTSLNELYDIAEANEITVMAARCPKCKAISLMSPNGRCYIGMDYDSIQSEREERQYLAHDLGHCVKGAFYNPYSPFSLIEQQEYRADKAAVYFLVPKEKLVKAIKSGCSTIWELSDFFDVDEKYIKKAYWVYFDQQI